MADTTLNTSTEEVMVTLPDTALLHTTSLQNEEEDYGLLMGFDFDDMVQDFEVKGQHQGGAGGERGGGDNVVMGSEGKYQPIVVVNFVAHYAWFIIQMIHIMEVTSTQSDTT